MTDKITITSQMVAQGSYGLTKINRTTGQQIGHVINVWHVKRDGQIVGTYLTRNEAREVAREAVR